MAYPDTPLDQLKYWFWRVYTPLHPYVRDTSTYFGIVQHEGRQNYLIGTVHPDKSLKDLIEHLLRHGFGNHFVAWKDDDELVSLRKPVNFRYQYHLRIFKDGEVRCHYEYTPEYRPLQHLIQIGFEDRSHEFQKILEGWIVPAKRP